jgi:hypothetical protein
MTVLMSAARLPQVWHVSVVSVEYFMILLQKKFNRFNRQGSRVILHGPANFAWWLRNR